MAPVVNRANATVSDITPGSLAGQYRSVKRSRRGGMIVCDGLFTDLPRNYRHMTYAEGLSWIAASGEPS